MAEGKRDSSIPWESEYLFYVVNMLFGGSRENDNAVEARPTQAFLSRLPV